MFLWNRYKFSEFLEVNLKEVFFGLTGKFPQGMVLSVEVCRVLGPIEIIEVAIFTLTFVFILGGLIIN